MIERLYVHNFRCLEGFELLLGAMPSALLIGKNGAGKSSVGYALELLQKIARGSNRVGDLLGMGDFFLGRTDAPMRFEIAALLDGRRYEYKLALELPAGFEELRVASESLSCDGESLFARDRNRVGLSLGSTSKVGSSELSLNWFLIALPLLYEPSAQHPLAVFRRWLARSIVVTPVPSLISGESSEESLEPDRGLAKLAAWFSGLMATEPASYRVLDSYMKTVMPDFGDIKNPTIGNRRRNMTIQFRAGGQSISLPLAALSDGEKCFLICGMILASNRTYGPLLCFWDEPDSHLSIDEVGQFVAALRRGFQSGGQILLSSHNAEVMRRFSDDNTLLLYRKSHLEQTLVRKLSDLPPEIDRVGALLLGGLEQWE